MFNLIWVFIVVFIIFLATAFVSLASVLLNIKNQTALNKDIIALLDYEKQHATTNDLQTRLENIEKRLIALSDEETMDLSESNKQVYHARRKYHKIHY